MRHATLAHFVTLWFALALIPAVLAQAGKSSAASDSTEAQRFRKYLSEDWARWMTEYPEMATQIGYPGHDTRWTNDSPDGIQERIRHLQESLATLKQFDRGKLSAREQLNYGVYRELLETANEGLRYHDDPQPFRQVVPHNLAMPINQIEGIQQGAASVIAVMPRSNTRDYENILARLEALPSLVEQNLALLQNGLKLGLTPPKITLRDVPKQIDDLIPQDPAKSPLLRPFQEFPPSLGAQDRERILQKAIQTYSGSIVPAFHKLREYLAGTYIPACRENIAASALPEGATAYAFRVRWHTTTARTPQQIHEIGLAEVKRIRAEMDQVIASTGFKGTFAEFTEFLRTDARFYFADEESLVNAYRVIAKRADPELPRLFGKLPRLTYGVTPIPAFKAPSQTTAYYQEGSPSAGRPGEFFVNTYNLGARPKWEMEALSLHESVPGHHLQIALAQEIEDVPEFRKHIGYSAFVEGWGLYAEGLGTEMGFYKDPYSKFGQLTYEMWRAIRLVVDTGMHSMGWSREQALRFFRENSGKTDQDITVEIDRYIVWPGQALAYKTGQMKIRELRAEAERELGGKFDLRAFHDAVLAEGAVPLEILEARMKEWIARRKTP
jgi:uncharacterized protein (DUF885 family)